MFQIFRQDSQQATRLISLASQIPPPLDAFSLCKVAEKVLEIKIETIPTPELPPKISGIIHRLNNGHVEIVYRPSFNRLSVQISILHELAHLLLGHDPKKPVRLLSESVYIDLEERHAEWLAYLLVDFLVKYNENPILTRFVRLISPSPKFIPSKKPDQRPVLRFRAVIGS